MASVIKVFKTLRNHWKKSVFASALFGYLTNKAVNKYETLSLMRAYCEEAKKHGDEPLAVSKKPRHVTVILNPSAKDGKGKALFEKYAAPLFYLAGLKVSLVQTEYEGQAKSLMEIMDNTDAVVVAGGDGTLSEAVTGLLRRNDRDSAIKRFPVGVLPLGKTNTLAKSLFWNKEDSEVRWITEAAMAIIRNSYKPIDIMSVEAEPGKVIYAVGKVNWGAFRDTEVKIPKYWYWGPLKAKAAYFFQSMKKWPRSFQANIEYTPPCSGCSKCYQRQNVPSINNNTSTMGKRWWQAFIKPTEQFSNSQKTIDYSKIINDQCSIWQTGEYQSTEISVSTKNVDPEKADNQDSFLEVSLAPNDLTRTEFYTEGINHLQTGRCIGGERAQIMQAKEVRLTPVLNKEEESWYSIDNEAFEVKPIVIKLLPKNLYVYYKK